jgi:hypothetical protein
MSLLFSHPIKKLTLLAAFGGGYVLGARAGRERYEQIRQTAQQVADDPRVQQATSQAQEFVRDAAEKVKDDPRVQDVAERVQTAAQLVGDTVEAAGPAGDNPASDNPASDSSTSTGVHPLLADEHIGLEEEIVYSAGPDIEESIDELADIDPTSNPAAEGRQADA